MFKTIGSIEIVARSLINELLLLVLGQPAEMAGSLLHDYGPRFMVHIRFEANLLALDLAQKDLTLVSLTVSCKNYRSMSSYARGMRFLFFHRGVFFSEPSTKHDYFDRKHILGYEHSFMR